MAKEIRRPREYREVSDEVQGTCNSCGVVTKGFHAEFGLCAKCLAALSQPSEAPPVVHEFDPIDNDETGSFDPRDLDGDDSSD